MSYAFEIGSETVWSPALKVGEIYKQYVLDLESLWGVSAGFEQLSEDMISIDADKFSSFVMTLIGMLKADPHKILELQLRPVILPALVMLARGGFDVGVLNVPGFMQEAESYARNMSA